MVADGVREHGVPGCSREPHAVEGGLQLIAELSPDDQLVIPLSHASEHLTLQRALTRTAANHPGDCVCPSRPCAVARTRASRGNAPRAGTANGSATPIVCGDRSRRSQIIGWTVTTVCPLLVFLFPSGRCHAATRSLCSLVVGRACAHCPQPALVAPPDGLRQRACDGDPHRVRHEKRCGEARSRHARTTSARVVLSRTTISTPAASGLRPRWAGSLSAVSLGRAVRGDVGDRAERAPRAFWHVRGW